MTNAIPRLIIAGTHSGVGKTIVSIGIMAALRDRGLRVQPFKAGPDYIDPTYHALAAGRAAHNLDAWMIPRERIPALFAHAARNADVAIIEGVMGLYDGFDYENERGSTAELARLLAAPVVMIVDARAMARSAAAVALGYREFATDAPWAGFIVNRVGSEEHGRGVARAIEQATGLPVFGWLPRADQLHAPERHLGLTPTAEPGPWSDLIALAAALVERHINLDALLKAARKAPAFSTPALELPTAPPIGQRKPILAVARDRAFSFIYPANLELLQAAGAEIAFFSPLCDADLPREASGVILSGGFPEMYAAELAANRSMLAGLRQAHARGLPIYAECGGLMYLTESIIDHEGRSHKMVGLLPGHSRLGERLTLGYRLAEAVADSWLLKQGERVRGHEFHYSHWEAGTASLPPAFRLLPTRRGQPERREGARIGSLWASYVHLHFWSNPHLALRFAAACRGSGFEQKETVSTGQN
ncbi:MAG: cobyrinate a,c-diamide synthase [Chloroflexi bacterium]|nr:cobyrinate a,c-diamide synthase [Chloroflexota bacterium]